MHLFAIFIQFRLFGVRLAKTMQVNANALRVKRDYLIEDVKYATVSNGVGNY